ncbi:unnamed protein product [Didymodactylos carnosus]|uniref:Uncharacterized protein n=1 Tax=Didymodactylos carnosus TaxID=1234261 RepID=A0A814CMY3_9BILA|nr:unnamed protein product [Didymodactylos carnosus]CAF1288145.1 unnamed protein product [Didymodactylos carnosus]CAF3722909.1 unnamed protein product [Didymodactylos carnosus]CAF4093098.1 unnamed protein product [Didymodactylos carnosus]
MTKGIPKGIEQKDLSTGDTSSDALSDGIFLKSRFRAEIFQPITSMRSKVLPSKGRAKILNPLYFHMVG